MNRMNLSFVATARFALLGLALSAIGTPVHGQVFNPGFEDIPNTAWTMDCDCGSTIVPDPAITNPACPDEAALHCMVLKLETTSLCASSVGMQHNILIDGLDRGYWTMHFEYRTTETCTLQITVDGVTRMAPNSNDCWVSAKLSSLYRGGDCQPLSISFVVCTEDSDPAYVDNVHICHTNTDQTTTDLLTLAQCQATICAFCNPATPLYIWRDLGEVCPSSTMCACQQQFALAPEQSAGDIVGLLAAWGSPSVQYDIAAGKGTVDARDLEVMLLHIAARNRNLS